MANSNRVEHASETWLTDATVFEVNRTPAHSNHKCFTHDPQSGEHSDLTQSLDGEWRVEIVQASDIDFNESHSLLRTSMIPLSAAPRFRAICRWQAC